MLTQRYTLREHATDRLASESSPPAPCRRNADWRLRTFERRRNGSPNARAARHHARRARTDGSAAVASNHPSTGTRPAVRRTLPSVAAVAANQPSAGTSPAVRVRSHLFARLCGMFSRGAAAGKRASCVRCSINAARCESMPPAHLPRTLRLVVHELLAVTNSTSIDQ